ncbi:BCN_G0004810.mRNA.1.CDS.1 [Saccharomyces cerevisiae]|nr:BCN_G0004810.mRNA.1.CDS.1 [Saccharomyces cerevisiae]CAI4292127.1 BCE_3a_G0004750.mRNA.1.CDS.1 [Saccharomyces cerevisiae]CAI7051210.1 BCN_G0004810.mRNA.1.CDS.1 [Saccharomyces cerevisiae]CAI7051786.1 BCE_3a_G0004750.mRNA.1.CDS.1 [Saccharomyces cerevisiae]
MLCVIKNTGYRYPRTGALNLLRGRPFNMATRKITTERIPGPPKLPREEQEEFERLQRIATSQEAIDQYNAQATGDRTKESLNSPLLTKNDIGSFSPEFSKTIPEFEGDVNPKTGEVGGPKQDPLRHGDYSFNGRVTDF